MNIFVRIYIILATKKKNYFHWTTFDMQTALKFLLDNIFASFGDTVYRIFLEVPWGQIVTTYYGLFYVLLHIAIYG